MLTQLPARTDNTVYVEMADAQRGPYAEQQPTLARLLQKKYLTEVDRRRILACLANLRMLCDSTFLLDKQTNVSPKLDEFAELLRELLGARAAQGGRVQPVGDDAAQGGRGAGPAAASATRCCTAACRARTGGRCWSASATTRTCRVFLSTDAGGTGLNLQAADTVINLEVPWNPAVLEQRIARVHRMGQHRPVQVFNLVTRDSIEERVLRTLRAEALAVRRRVRRHGRTRCCSQTWASRRSWTRCASCSARSRPRNPRAAPQAEGADPPAGAGRRRGAVPRSAGRRPRRPTAHAAAANGAHPPLVGIDARTGQAVLQVPLPAPELLQRGSAALHTLLRATTPQYGEHKPPDGK